MRMKKHKAEEKYNIFTISIPDIELQLYSLKHDSNNNSKNNSNGDSYRESKILKR